MSNAIDAMSGVDLGGFSTNTEAGNVMAFCSAAGQFLTLIPRKAANIFDSDKTVKRVLPRRYPPASDPTDGLAFHLKNIEYNFYPDLAETRTVTAVATRDSWNYKRTARTQPDVGRTVQFTISKETTINLANVTLMPAEATTNAEGCAEVKVKVTLDAELSKEHLLNRQNRIVLTATLTTDTQEKIEQSLVLVIHRNEDVNTPVDSSERPTAFQKTLKPVRSNETWLVFQPKLPVESEGVKAVLQLLNQVACRRQGNHPFLNPTVGLFDARAQGAVNSFRTAFATAPTGTPITDYRRTRFGVRHEPEVLSYITAEYDQADPAPLIIDSHLLEGKETWRSGRRVMPQSQDDIVGADGLLDIYTAVVWRFIERVYGRALEYANAQTRWCRHPNDFGQQDWPELVTRGVAYTYGASDTLEDFVQHYPPNNTIAHWNEYHETQNPHFIGLHMNSNKYGSACNWVILQAPAAGQVQIPLITRHDVLTAIGTSAATNMDIFAANRRIVHNWDANLGYYSGIDCSAFIWRCSREALFGATHCTDLASERIWRNGETIPRQSTAGWPDHYRQILINGNPAHRRTIVFRGDILNRSGHHVVFLETADRAGIASNEANPHTRIRILQAHGELSDFDGNNNECARRVIESPLSAWGTANSSWLTDNNASTAAQHGRLYLWS